MGFLAPIAMPLAIASSVLGAFGSVTQGLAMGAAGKAQQKALNQAASLQRRQGALNALQVQREGARFRGEQLAAIAGSGIDVAMGSPLEMLADTQREIDWRVATTRWEAEAGATGLENQGRQARWEGNVRQSAAFGQAVGALFKGAGQLGLSSDPLATLPNANTGLLDIPHGVA